MPSFRQKQTRVAVGMGAGLALTIAAFAWPVLPAVPAGTDERISLWLACSLFVAAWLLVAVARLAAHRFFSPADIDGRGLAENTSRAALLQALIQNSVEQVLLAILAYGAWLWLGPEHLRGLVIVFAAYFAMGRLLFFAGYARGAAFRALGFALTFYPSAGLFLGLLPAAAARLFAF